MNRIQMLCEAGEAITNLTGPACQTFLDIRRQIDELREKEHSSDERILQSMRALEKVARIVFRRAIRKTVHGFSLDVNIDCTELYDHSTPLLDRRPHLRVSVHAVGIRYEMQLCPVAFGCIEKAAGQMAAAVSAVKSEKDRQDKMTQRALASIEATT